MADGTEERPHEIVLIRRRHDGDHDEPHGGVWKVAFADFMTAMMAFFLVLWIVNSTSKETRSSVARYFNPVKLADSTPARKGLKEAREEDFDAAGVDPNAAPPDKPSKDKPEAPVKGEGKPPIGEAPKLEAIKKQPPPLNVGRAASERQSPPAQQQSSVDENKDYRDPFERKSKTTNPNPAIDAQKESARVVEALARDAKNLKAALSQSLGVEEMAKLGSALNVSVEADGVLISLTDKSDFGMFAIGSADPEQRLVRALGAIVQALSTREGNIVVRGHTDARRYKTGIYDNWQLSSARAQAAYYVLVRNGLDEKRVEKIEGYADHRLKSTNDPGAPENRRIEILLRRDGA